MVRKIERGDAVRLAGTVDKTWPNGLVTVYLRGYEYPVTLHKDAILEVLKAPAARSASRRRKFYDKPD